MEDQVRCNWCGIITDKWCWQQKQKDGNIIAKCQKCVDERKVIPLIKGGIPPLSRGNLRMAAYGMDYLPKGNENDRHG